MKQTFFLLFTLFWGMQNSTQVYGALEEVEESVTRGEKMVPLGQNYSLIQWEKVDPIDFLSLEHWKLDLVEKDKNPNWEEKYRRNVQIEPMGRVLSCRGECWLHRGLDKIDVEFNFQVFEGDEFSVGEDSVAWLFFLDGTLIRISPNSSVNLQEINFSSDEAFIRVRLNQGHLFWSHKKSIPLEENLSPETDAHSLPLRVLGANLEFFEREFSREIPEAKELEDIFNLNEVAHRNQIKKINDFRSSFKDTFSLKSKGMVSTANMSLILEESSLDIFYSPGKESFFKLRDGEKIEVVLRGYKESTPSVVTSKEWQQVAHQGREMSELESEISELRILEFLTKRIKSIELAREILIQKYTIPILNTLSESKKMAYNYGLFLWEKRDFERRIDFLKFEIKRIETAHLKSVINMMKKEEKKILNESLYRFSLNQYLLGLKKRYGIEKTQVKNMTDLQYYIWTLKNGKL